MQSRMPPGADAGVLAALDEAGSLLARAFQGPVAHAEKSRNDLVTRLDAEVEGLLVARLRALAPSRPVFGEESGTTGGTAEERWIVDPIDGTANFVFGVPYFAVVVALEDASGIRQAYVLNPVAGELYYARREGGPSLLNGDPIRVSTTRSMRGALVALGFSANRANIERYFREWPRLFAESRKAIGLLAPSLNLCNVARGRIDAFVDFASSTEGHAAASLIVEQAGGSVANYDGSAWDHRIPGVVASNGRLVGLGQGASSQSASSRGGTAPPPHRRA